MQITRYARTLSYIILGGVTVYGVWSFLASDSSDVLEYWQGKLPLVRLIIVLACLDVALEAIGWLWTYSRMGIRTWDAGGVACFLAGRAGLLMPAQLGRLIRPDALSRLRRGSMTDCLKAEAVTFALDATSVVALMAFLAALALNPFAALPVLAVVIVSLLFVGNRVAKALSGTRLALPGSFWWSWKTVATLVVEMAGWAVHGIALFIIIKDLPGHATCRDTVLFAAGSSVLGAGSGMPGGIGATEGLLGMSLSIMNVPAAHLALAIGAFRLFTFWIWIPVGWFALAAIRRRAPQPAAEPAESLPPVVIEPVGAGVLTPAE